MKSESQTDEKPERSPSLGNQLKDWGVYMSKQFVDYNELATVALKSVFGGNQCSRISHSLETELPCAAYQNGSYQAAASHRDLVDKECQRAIL